MTKHKRKRLNPHSNGPGLQPPRTKFGARLHRFLRDSGALTMADAAEWLGFSRHSLLVWRRGDATPSKASRRLLEAYMDGSVTPPGPNPKR